MVKTLAFQDCLRQAARAPVAGSRHEILGFAGPATFTLGNGRVDGQILRLDAAFRTNLALSR